MEQSQEKAVVNGAVVFQLHFVDSENGPLVIEATDGNNRIISFEVLASQLQQYWENGDDFIIKHGAKVLKNDRDVFAIVYAATMKDEKVIDITVETSRNEWELVETASQFSEDDNPLNRATFKRPSTPVSTENLDAENKAIRDDGSMDHQEKDKVAELEKGDISDAESVNKEEEEPIDSNIQENKLICSEAEENVLMALEEKRVDAEQAAHPEVKQESGPAEGEKNTEIAEKTNGACSCEVAKTTQGMPTQSIFDGSQISLNFDILSEDLSTPSFALGEWGAKETAQKNLQGPDAFEYPTWTEKKDNMKEVEGAENRKTDNVMSFASWDDKLEDREGAFENKSIEDTLKSLERFLSSDSKPNELKLRRLLSLLNSVIEEILLKIPENSSWNSSIKEALGESGDENFLVVLKQLASNPRVVREIQNALNSESIRNFIVDVALNDVSTMDELRKIVMSHVGDLLSTVGEVIRCAPQVLSILPHLLRWSVSFLYEEKKQPVSDSVRPVHTGVLCDGCDDNEKKACAISNGTISGAYICGIRYKSAVRDDFDLCETCEASGDFEEDYGPFLKIRTPAKAPREIVCVLNPTPFENEGSERPESSGQPSDPSGGERGELRCPRGGHPLSSFMVPNRLFACDVCDCTPNRGSVMYGCRMCDWDICRTCAIERYPDLNPSSGVERRNTTPTVQVPRAQVNVRPRATFVADVNFQDGSVLTAGTHFTKIWRVENSSKDVAWPNQCRIVCVGGDLMGAFPSGFLVPPLPPKQVGDICVQLVAPSKPGRYIGYWRLVTPQNERFGQRFWVDITVEDVGNKRGQDTGVEQRVAVADFDLDKWAAELQQLANMDFLDCEKNVTLLEQFHGNLEAVVNSLLSKD